MKKVVLAAVVALTVGLVACGGNGNGTAPATDSTAVDSTLVDSVAVATDSVKVDSSVVK
jgi:hypothetical protein